MAGRMPRRWYQRESVVELKRVVDEQSLSRLDDGPAIVAPRVPWQAPLEDARRRLAPRADRLPLSVLAFVKDVFRVRKGRGPPPIAKHGVPAGVVEMQMRAEDVRDVLQAQARGVEIVEPGLLGKVVRGRIAFVLAGARIDQDDVPWRAHEERLVGDHHAAAGGIEHDGVEFGEMSTPNFWIVGREHSP